MFSKQLRKTLAITVRKPNEEVVSPALTELKAARCMGTLGELERVMATRGVSREGLACFDETAMQLFGLIVLTLHWRGARNVPIPKSHRNKLSLSIAVISARFTPLADGTRMAPSTSLSCGQTPRPSVPLRRFTGQTPVITAFGSWRP